ncbi:hypothetical protein Taro_020749 [Colocasia esculenta]|uniref:Uncharacterized protein n=1 Tax=Colocasia esculenta TaxID=4460 RepID=A0A843V310_COLES|nr:hypothetical protein [Colocasia esculenta]
MRHTLCRLLTGKATGPMSPSGRRQALCRIQNATGAMSHSEGDRPYVAFSVQRQVVLPPLPFSLYCTRGTYASSLVRSHTSRSPGVLHLRACPVREVVTVTWDPRPREPVKEVLRATSVLELAAT